MTTSRRTESEAVRREQILKAARKVLDEKGYENTTVSDIVKEANVAQGTFYLYFRSKKDVIIELGQQVMQELVRRLMAAYDANMSFEEHLRMLVKNGFQVAHENPDLCKLLHVSAESVGNEMKERMRVENHPLVAGMVAMFRRAIDSGEMIPIDPDIAVRLLMAMMSSAMYEAHAHGSEGDAQRIGEAMEELVVNAFVRH